MNKKGKKLWKNQSGQALVIMAIMIPAILVIIGLAVDIGYVLNQKQKMQNAIDLSALAGSQMVNVNHGQVVSTAINISSKNGIPSNELTVTHPFSNDNSKVKLKATRNVNLFFMSIIGINSATISVEAVAQKKQRTIIQTTSKVFDYAVFSGSSSSKPPVMTMRGNGSTVTGNVHSNEGITIMGNDHVIKGNVTAVMGIQKFNTTVNGTVNGSAASVPMIQIDYNAYASIAKKVYNTNQSFSDTDINGITVINGDCQISGQTVTGKGILLVNGNLKISGNGLKYLTSNDMLAIYVKGDVQITGTNTNIKGVLYAPNGNIKIAGSGNTFEGALIANTIEWSGNDITISGKYDLRTPSAFTITEDYSALIQ
jgi:Flp pilus assembly protein TadG